jgi:hypothetical protein
MVLSYKTPLNKELFEILPASKNESNGKWECKIIYEGQPLVFTTPRLKLKECKLFFNITKKKAFLDFLESLDEIVVDNLAENTEKIFNGKVFKKEEIKSSMEPQIDIDENGTVDISTTFNENILFFNNFGDKIEEKDTGENVSANICLDKVCFTKNLLKLQFITRSLKASRFEKNNETFDEPLAPEQKKEDVSEKSIFFFD